MSIIDRVRIAAPLRVRRKRNQTNWPVSTLALIPGDEDNTTALVCARVENCREVLRKPGIPLLHGIVKRRTGVMHVITQVRRDLFLLSPTSPFVLLKWWTNRPIAP